MALNFDTKEIIAQLETCTDITACEAFFDQYLGKKGEFNAAFKQMKDLTPAQKKEA